MNPESKIQSQIIKYLESIGFFVFKIQSASKRGIPDLFAKKNEQIYFFEVKTDIGKLSPLQKVSINKLNVGKEIAYMVRSVEEVKKILLHNRL
ncbi:MAG: nuclease [Planctomycetota bacterium]|nr:MAG: nuclease [Planctomycetota bacterium]